MESKCRRGVVGVFHVQGVAWNFKTNENEVLLNNGESPKRLVSAVKPYDVENLRQTNNEGSFVSFRHRTGDIEVLHTGQDETDVALDHGEWEILTIVPIERISLDYAGSSVSWAPVGLSDMLNSGGALLSSDGLERVPTESIPILLNDAPTLITRASMTSRGPGKFISYCRPAPSHVLLDGKSYDSGKNAAELAFLYDETNGQLSFVLPNEIGSNGSPHSITVLWE